MKKITVIMILSVMAAFLLTSCGGLKIADQTSSLNGVTVTLDKVDTETVPNGSTVFSTYETIKNDSDENITKVSFAVVCKDQNGNELISVAMAYYAEDEALGKGESVKYERGFQQVLDNKPATMHIEVTEVLTDKDLPPIRLPKEGEHLYEALMDEKINHIKEEPPAVFVLGIDQGGYLREAVFDTPEAVAEAVELFTNITIGAETDEMVTDNYNYILLKWADGTTSSISLNRHNLELSVYSRYYIYELNGLGGLWGYAEEHAEEVEY